MRLHIVVIFFSSLLSAQTIDSSSSRIKESFTEWNFGIAFLPEGNSLTGGNTIFPGTSFLWGSTLVYKNNFIIEYAAGVSLPTIITGKVGVGKKFKNTKIIVGVRPFPFNIYAQSSLGNTQKGYWIVSIEGNPLNPELGISFESRALLTFGYRWYIQKKE